MLGKTADDIGKMQEYDKTGYAQVFEEVKFKTFLFKFRTKMETFSVSINICEILYETAHSVRYNICFLQYRHDLARWKLKVRTHRAYLMKSASSQIIKFL